MTASSPVADRGTAGAARVHAAAPGALRVKVVLGALAGAVVAVAGIAAYGTGYSYGPVPQRPATSASLEIPSDPKALKQMETHLKQRQKQLAGALDRRVPKGVYIVIDQTQNQLFLRENDTVLREAKCSAGSGMVLQETGGKGRKWVFDTPRGAFKVLSKMEDPVWKKPDWAFIEEGKPIPKNDSDRFDPGALGEYALYFGNGYMIHGTLYERYLGRGVSHGCIRVGRDDLREVFHAANLGTPIYIY
jgi:L,D-transpeptidase ErfK/SrfK